MKWRIFPLWVAGILLCAAVSFAPPFVKDAVVRPVAWGAILLASFAGFGGLVVKLARVPRAPHVDLGMKSALGLALLALVGGALTLVGLSRSPVLFALVLVGVALQGQHVRKEGRSRSLEAYVALVRRFPARVAILVAIASLALLAYVGAAADTSTNPYDDDVAYYPFVKQLLQAGTLLDPFSFRRMSTLGGQAFLHALVALRLDVVQSNLFDRGLCVVIVVWLIGGATRGSKKASFVYPALGAAFFLLLKNTSINSASYYSGVVIFLALYRSSAWIVRGSVRDHVVSATPMILLGAAACSLRQNYLVPVFAFHGLVVLERFGFKRGTRLPFTKAVSLSFALIVLGLLPWLCVLFRSNDTFLWPVMRGTFTQGASTTGASMTGSLQLQHLVSVFFMPDPIKTLPVLFLAGLFVREGLERRRAAFFVWTACIIGVAALSVSFNLSDPGNLARYDYGFVTAAVLFTWRTLGESRQLRGNLIPKAVYAFGMAYQVVMFEGHPPHPRDLHTRLRDIDEKWHYTIPYQGTKRVEDTYRALQEKVPPGEKILALVDEPYGFHFGRNPILNLDLPGLSGKAPGFCAFRGPEALAEYLVQTGSKYLALVEADRSVYLFRKEIWFDNMYHRDEIWRIYAPYVLDSIENFDRLKATRKVLYRGDGMVLLDLSVKVQ